VTFGVTMCDVGCDVELAARTRRRQGGQAVVEGESRHGRGVPGGGW
jgi:hypothetical protein